jgi:hypothetical protein
MIRRMLLILGLAAAFLTGSVAGAGIIDVAGATGVGIRDADGFLRAYLGRNGHLLIVTGDGYRYEEVDAVTASRLINTATIISGEVESTLPFTIEVDGQPRLSILDPRDALPDDPDARAFIDALWREIALREGVPARAPSIRIWLTPLLDAPSGSVEMPATLVDLAAATSDGDRFSGDRLTALVAWRAPFATGAEKHTYPVRVAGVPYALRWSADPSQDEISPASAAE